MPDSTLTLYIQPVFFLFITKRLFFLVCSGLTTWELCLRRRTVLFFCSLAAVSGETVLILLGSVSIK